MPQYKKEISIVSVGLKFHSFGVGMIRKKIFLKFPLKRDKAKKVKKHWFNLFVIFVMRNILLIY